MNLRPHTSAFTLIELSIGLTILSLLAAGALTVGGVMVEQQQFTGSNERVAEAKQALLDYFSVNGRLPCPARRTEAPGTVDFGVAVDCTVAGAAPAGTLRRSATAAFSGAAYTQGVVRIGALPVRTLGLRDSAMADEYGNRILYAMTERFASNNVAHISDALGAITLLDAKDNVIATASTDNGAVFVVFSTGPDGKGGYRYSTGSSPVSCSGGLDAENCDANITFRDTRFNNGKVAAEYFDDMLAWSPKYLLTSLVASSKAAGSTGQVQYNNGGFLSATPSFFWDITNARLGIGTSTPTQTLHIAGNGGSGGNQTGAQIGSVGTGEGPLFLVYNSPHVAGNAYFNAQWRYGGGTGKPATIGLSNGIHFYTSNAAVGAANAAISDFNTAMIITPSGDVGIGTSPSTATKLHVNGSIIMGQTSGPTAADGWGPTLQIGGNTTNNSDAFYFQRHNYAPDNSILYLSLGDNTDGLDSFIMISGEMNGHTRRFQFLNNGMLLINGQINNDYVLNAYNSGTHAVVGNGSKYGVVGYGRDWDGVGVHGNNSNTGAYAHLGHQRFGVYAYGTGGGQYAVQGLQHNGYYAGLARDDGYGIVSNGNAWFAGTYYASDRRLKEDIHPIEHSLDAIMALKPVHYNWKKNTGQGRAAQYRPQVGLIAQDVEKVLPDIVSNIKLTPAGKPVDANGKPISHTPSLEEELGTIKNLEYSKFVPYLIGAVQELKHETDTLKAASPAVGPQDEGGAIEQLQQTNRLLIAIIIGQFALWAVLAIRVRRLGQPR